MSQENRNQGIDRCDPTKSTDASARSVGCCAGASSAAPGGSAIGSIASSSHAARPLSKSSERTRPASGGLGIEVHLGTGAERCADCMVGQGDDCHCRTPLAPLDPRVRRWVWLADIAFWVVLVVLVVNWSRA